MPKKIIHIGLHKTGTTYLQRCVFPYLPGYVCLTRPYTQFNRAFNRLQHADDSCYDESELKTELEAFRGSNLIISDEALSGKQITFSDINKSMIARRLANACPDAEILLLLRDQVDNIASQYSSYVKMGGYLKMSEFIHIPRGNYTYGDYQKGEGSYPSKTHTPYYDSNKSCIHVDSYKYSNLVELYRSLFSKVHIFLYEDFRKNYDRAFDRMEDVFGCSVSGRIEKKVNVALSSKRLEARRLANHLRSSQNKYVVRALEFAFYSFTVGRNLNYRDETREIVGKYFEEDNALLKKSVPQLNWSDFPNYYR